MKKQKHRFMEAYFTFAEWQSIEHGDGSKEDALLGMAVKMQTLGMKHVDEITYMECALLATLKHGILEVEDECLRCVRLLKQFHRKRLGLVMPGPDEYPPSPHTLQQTHPALYANAFNGDAAVAPRMDRSKDSVDVGNSMAMPETEGVNPRHVASARPNANAVQTDCIIDRPPWLQVLHAS